MTTDADAYIKNLKASTRTRTLSESEKQREQKRFRDNIANLMQSISSTLYKQEIKLKPKPSIPEPIEETDTQQLIEQIRDLKRKNQELHDLLEISRGFSTLCELRCVLIDDSYTVDEKIEITKLILRKYNKQYNLIELPDDGTDDEVNYSEVDADEEDADEEDTDAVES